MANVIKMPLLSDTMEEGIIADVFYKVGDQINGGDIIAEVETDKATMEVEAYDEHEGTLLYIANSGDAVPVGGVLAITGDQGEEFESLLNAQPEAQPEASPEAIKEESPAPVATTVASAAPATTNGRVKASPLAKKMAEQEGINLSQIKGSGDDGRVVKRDVELALKSGTGSSSSASASSFVTAAPVGKEEVEVVKVSQMRKTIAKRLAESKFTMPHFYLTIEINMDNSMAARSQMNELSPVKISFNDLVMKSAAMALHQHPEVNSSWMGDTIEINKHINIGMAVAIPQGLVVPVLRFADQMPLSVMAATSKELAGKAREGNLGLDEMQGGTFSVSNLGSMGIEEFTAIINPPNAAIMAVGGISKRFREVNGEMKAVNIMKVTLSCDHRVIDGAVGSSFLATFKKYLENPALMLV